MAPAAITPEVMASASDTALLSAVVRTIRAEGRVERTIVDPRPLLPVSDIQSVTPRTFVSVPPAVLQQREAALRNSGVEFGDAVALGVPSCPGLIFPTRRNRNAKRSCPREQIYVVAIGLPRPGTARLPTGQAYSRAEGTAAEGYWAVRVVGRTVGPSGASDAASDYVMRRDSGWTFVTKVTLMISD